MPAKVKLSKFVNYGFKSFMAMSPVLVAHKGTERTTKMLQRVSNIFGQRFLEH
jgi:hypothetical protein